jgi:hypothetical protein
MAADAAGDEWRAHVVVGEQLGFGELDLRSRHRSPMD